SLWQDAGRGHHRTRQRSASHLVEPGNQGASPEGAREGDGRIFLRQDHERRLIGTGLLPHAGPFTVPSSDAFSEKHTTCVRVPRKWSMRTSRGPWVSASESRLRSNTTGSCVCLARVSRAAVFIDRKTTSCSATGRLEPGRGSLDPASTT